MKVKNRVKVLKCVYNSVRMQKEQKTRKGQYDEIMTVYFCKFVQY